MSTKIFIALLNDKFGGAEQVTKLIVNYFLKEGYSVDVFFVTKSKGSFWSEYEQHSKVKLIRTSILLEKFGFIGFIKNVIKNRKTRYEYAFTSHIYLNALVSILRGLGLVNTRWFISRDSHSYYLVDKGKKLIFYDFLIKIGYRNQDLLISQTEEMREQLLLNNNRNKKICNFVKVINNPIELSNVIIDEQLVVPERSIIAAGRLMKIKGFDSLLLAFEKFNRSRNYSLIILGDGPEEQNLKMLTNKLGLTNNVFFLGFQKDVYSYFNKADICIVSSVKEGFPNVLLQMMSQNTNVISTLCAGGIQEIKGLITCNPEKVDELYESLVIASTMGRNPENRILFDEELSKRTIDSFIFDIRFYLQKLEDGEAQV